LETASDGVGSGIMGAFPKAQYRVIVSRPGQQDETQAYEREQSALPVAIDEVLVLDGGRHVVVTEIVEDAVPGRQMGTIRARSQTSPS
jgi:hypothetical protein